MSNPCLHMHNQLQGLSKIYLFKLKYAEVVLDILSGLNYPIRGLSNNSLSLYFHYLASISMDFPMYNINTDCKSLTIKHIIPDFL